MNVDLAAAEDEYNRVAKERDDAVRELARLRRDNEMLTRQVTALLGISA